MEESSGAAEIREQKSELQLETIRRLECNQISDWALKNSPNVTTQHIFSLYSMPPEREAQKICPSLSVRKKSQQQLVKRSNRIELHKNCFFNSCWLFFFASLPSAAACWLEISLNFFFHFSLSSIDARSKRTRCLIEWINPIWSTRAHNEILPMRTNFCCCLRRRAAWRHKRLTSVDQLLSPTDWKN